MALRTLTYKYNSEDGDDDIYVPIARRVCPGTGRVASILLHCRQAIDDGRFNDKALDDLLNSDDVHEWCGAVGERSPQVSPRPWPRSECTPWRSEWEPPGSGTTLRTQSKQGGK